MTKSILDLLLTSGQAQQFAQFVELQSICRLILPALAAGQIEHSLEEELTPLTKGEKNGNGWGGLRLTSWHVSRPGFRSGSTQHHTPPRG